MEGLAERNDPVDTAELKCCGGSCSSKSDALFFAQIGIVYILIIISLINLTAAVSPTELWVSLLASAVGYLMPTPDRERSQKPIRTDHERSS